jgi:hypothetical protein
LLNGSDMNTFHFRISRDMHVPDRFYWTATCRDSTTSFSRLFC